MGWGGNKGKGKGKGDTEMRSDRPDTQFSKKLVTMLRCGEWWEEAGREMDEQGYADLEWVRRERTEVGASKARVATRSTVHRVVA